MANISVTYTLQNSATSDASEVNTNFQDIIDGTSDSTKDFSINALTCAGAVTLNGNVTLGNATTDDITVTGRIASDIDPKTAATYSLGDSTQTWAALYLDNTTTDSGAIYFDAGTTEYIKGSADGTDLSIGGFTGLNLGTAEIKRMSLHDVAKSDAYTVLDTDGVSVIHMTTGASDRVVTLPTAADNAGRVITCKKVDSGAGRLLLDGEGSETIDGETGNTAICPLQYDYVTVQCDGSAWHIIGRNYVSKWVAFTPSLSTGDATFTNVSSYYRRVHNSVEIKLDLTYTGTGSVAATQQFTIPGSLTATLVDTTSSSQFSQGYGIWYDSSGGANTSLAPKCYSTTTIGLNIATETSDRTLLDNEVGSGDRLNLFITIPVSEWTD